MPSKSPKIDLVMFPSDSPFFIKDIMKQYKVGRSSVFNFIKYHHDWFEETGNTRSRMFGGRPEKEYRLK
jgi:hypothetical protein